VTNDRFTDVEVANPLVKLCSPEWFLGITRIQRFTSYREISSCHLDGFRYVSVSVDLRCKRQILYPCGRESSSVFVEQYTLLRELVSSCLESHHSNLFLQKVPVRDMLASMTFIGLVRTPPSLSIARGPVGVDASLRP
jgi:hypothetical protein